MRLALLFVLTSLMLTFCLQSCKDSVVEEPSEMTLALELSAVTGVRFADDNGNAIGQVGNPNVTKEGSVIFYPNPNNGIMQLQNTDSQLFDIWIVKGEKLVLTQDLTFEDADFDYTRVTLDAEQASKIVGTAASIAIDLSGFETGYYRIMAIDANGKLTIENMYIDNALSANAIIDFLQTEF